MATAVSPARPEVPPIGLPTISYRNPVPPAENLPFRAVTNLEESINPAQPKSPTIRQIRQSMVVPQQTPMSDNLDEPSATSFPLSQRKKGSILGGLFAVKEPTQVALNQVAAQMIAQHGSTDAKKVPNVRLQKMPDHVPKVNSKWDGIPEAVKQKDKYEKDRQRVAKRQSLIYPGSAYKTNELEKDRAEKRTSRQSTTTSTTERNHRRSDVSTPNVQKSKSNPHRFYAQSVNSSGDLASQQREEGQQCRRSSAETGHSSRPSRMEPVRTSSEDTVSIISESQYSVSETADDEHTQSVPSSPVVAESEVREDEVEPDSHQTSFNEPLTPPMSEQTEEFLPEHAQSPTPTPQERSPVTPTTFQRYEFNKPTTDTTLPSVPEEMTLNITGPGVLAPPLVTKKTIIQDADTAFLAGEAKPFELPDDDEDEDSFRQQDLPLRQWGSEKGLNIKASAIDRVQQDLEKRPHSSRTRLGLRASMVVTNENAPWEKRHSSSDSSGGSGKASNNRSSSQMSPKFSMQKTFNLFGKDKS